MARKEKNPIKTMMIVNTVLIVGVLAVIIFWSQKTNESGKTGRVFFSKNSEGEPEQTTVAKTVKEPEQV